MAYKLPKLLSPADYRIHILALRKMQDEAQAEGRKIPIREMQEHLEPLLLHWPLVRRTCTIPLMSDELFTQTGIKLAPTSISHTIRYWGLTPVNGPSRGAARTQPRRQVGKK